MAGQFHGDGPPDALASLQRIYGFLLAHPNGHLVMREWHQVSQGLSVVADYHKVVSELASVACQLVDMEKGPTRIEAAKRLMALVGRLQNVSPSL